MPRRTRVLARSVAPVKSSAMQPSRSSGPSGISGEPGHRIRTKLDAGYLLQSLPAPGEKTWIDDRLYKGGFIEHVNPRGAVKTRQLHLARSAGQVGEPEHPLLSRTVGERRDVLAADLDGHQFGSSRFRQ